MRRFPRRLAASIAVLFAAVCGWFLLVDLSWFEEHCPDCGYARTDIQWRLMTVPVHTWEDRSPTVIQRVASDLGVPCQHSALHRWQKQRWWGLLICKCPCHNGIVSFGGDDAWYDAAAREKLRELAKADPNLANDFQRQVLAEHNYARYREIVQQIIEPEPLQTD